MLWETLDPFVIVRGDPMRSLFSWPPSRRPRCQRLELNRPGETENCVPVAESGVALGSIGWNSEWDCEGLRGYCTIKVSLILEIYSASGLGGHVRP